MVKICVAIVPRFTGDWYKLRRWNLMWIRSRRIENIMIKNPVDTRFTRHLRIKLTYVLANAVWVLSLIYAGTDRVEYREPASSVGSNHGWV